MKTIVNHYSNIPCIGRNCIHWGGEYREEIVRKAGYSEVTGLYIKEPFLSVWIGEHCNRSAELAEIRKEIYDRAFEASDRVYLKGYNSISTTVRKAGTEFDRIADEWRNLKCPFFEKKEDDNES